ncbi:MAG: agmatinase family protein [Bacteroidia bacterium]|nr:agmatinase family protein [Bacteroidia bacterium]
MSKQEKINNFNPNDLGDVNAGIFGLPFTTDEAEVVIVPVPWEVTVSYTCGTAKGPDAVFDASFQVDLFDPFVKDAWKTGIAMDEMNIEIQDKSDTLREKAEEYLDLLSKGDDPEESQLMKGIRKEINAACEWMNAEVKKRVLHFLEKKKIVGLLGGDHSTPLGMMQALAEKFGEFGILQIDAHADLRDAFEGFQYSHASIMFNALKIKEVNKLVQVGIRDYCEDEFDLIKNSNGRVKTFFDRDLKQARYAGENWSETCDRIIAELPNKIYLSFDIDGLDPKLCPNTGTPVAGGFETEEILFLLEKIVKSGKKIIAFDINEIAPGEDEWDANVGARLLYRISNMVALSNGITV